MDLSSDMVDVELSDEEELFPLPALNTKNPFDLEASLDADDILVDVVEEVVVILMVTSRAITNAVG